MDFTQSDKATTAHTTRRINISGGELLSRLLSIRSLIVVVILLQVLTVSLVLKPTWINDLFYGSQDSQVISEVKSLTTITSTGDPVVAKVQDADALREENAIQAEIYKDTQNGDYVIGYSDRLIVYRRSEGKIIYDGETPSEKLSKNNEIIAEKISTKLQSEGILDVADIETPQMTLVSEPAKFQEQDASFYGSLQANDIIAVYNEARLIVIYRFDQDQIVNVGSFQTQIDPQVAGLGTSN